MASRKKDQGSEVAGTISLEEHGFDAEPDGVEHKPSGNGDVSLVGNVNVHTPSASRAGGKPIKTKRERFLEQVERRVNQAVKALGRVRNLANRASYEYTDLESERIVKELEEQVIVTRQRFEGRSKIVTGWKL